jgi:hypothetical protein
MGACAKAARVVTGPAIAASATVTIVLRSIMAAPLSRGLDSVTIAEPAGERCSTSRYGRSGGTLHHGSGSSGM